MAKPAHGERPVDELKLAISEGVPEIIEAITFNLDNSILYGTNGGTLGSINIATGASRTGGRSGGRG